MSDTVATKSGPDQWSLLLQEARHALASLRAEDLGELAARAECMLAATLGPTSIRQRIAKPTLSNLSTMSREHRLLGDLLTATRANLKIVNRTRTGLGTSRTAEVNSRWVR